MKFYLILSIIFFYAAKAPAQKKQDYKLRSWVRDSLPAKSDSITDMQRMDMIYLKALQINNYRKETALYDCIIATLEHHSIPFGIKLKLPVTQEKPEEFYSRAQKLPGKLFAD